MHILGFSLTFLAFASTAQAADFTLSSPDLTSEKAPASLVSSKAYGFGCNGANIAPALNWSGAPEGTKSFVLTLYDKDAPTGVGFMHWVVVNIPASQTSLPAGGVLPAAVLQTRSDLGIPGFVGICPPAGETHTYVLTLTALKVATLPVDANTTPAVVGFLAHTYRIADTRLSFTYGR